MDNFIWRATRAGGICSFFWNIAHSFDFDDAHKNFQETWKKNEEAYKKAKEDFKSFDSSFTILPVVVPVVMVLMFLVCSVIICCIAHRRRQQFWAMQQEQQRLLPPPLPVAPGPGPVTSGATTYGYSNWNPAIPRAVTLPPPEPYAVQPAGLYQTDGRYPAPLMAAPGPGLVASSATNYAYSSRNPPVSSGAILPPFPPYPPQPAELHPASGPYSNFDCAPSAQPLSAAGSEWPSAPPPYSCETKQVL